MPVTLVGVRGHFFICSERVEDDFCVFAIDVNRMAWVDLWGDREGTEWGGKGIILPASFFFPTCAQAGFVRCPRTSTYSTAVTSETGWDLEPGTFYCSACTWTSHRIQRNYKGRKITAWDGNKDADLLENGLEDTGRGKDKLGQSERVVVYIWTYIHYQM